MSVRTRRGASTSATDQSTSAWRSILVQLFSIRSTRIVFLTTAVVVMLAYFVLLPFDYTQQISLGNLHYLSVRLVGWSLVLGLSMALVIALQAYSIRTLAVAKGRSGTVGAVAFLASLLPSLLCCTPIVPTVLALIGLSTVSLYGATGAVQYFMATRQNYVLLFSLVVMAASAVWSLRKISQAMCLTQGCEVPTNNQ